MSDISRVRHSVEYLPRLTKLSCCGGMPHLSSGKVPPRRQIVNHLTMMVGGWVGVGGGGWGCVCVGGWGCVCVCVRVRVRVCVCAIFGSI